MNWETIIVASIASMGSALVGLIPMFAKMRADAKKAQIDARAAESARLDELEARRQAEISDTTNRAIQETITRLSGRVAALEKDRDALEIRLDEERAKRRTAEENLSKAEIGIERLKSKVEKLEKRDTGELKGKP